MLAAPIIWTGLELARAHLLTGMSMASLGHTQYRWIDLIQLSDLAGAYGVSFVVMFVAASLARMIPVPSANAPPLQWGGAASGCDPLAAPAGRGHVGRRADLWAVRMDADRRPNPARESP